jgi:omega-amidase
MDDLKIALVQPDLSSTNRDANLDMYAAIIAGQIDDPVDLILLPEMFNTGYTANMEQVTEEMSGPSIRFLSATASARNCALMATLLVHDGTKRFNRQITAFSDGTIHFNDKRHLFRLSDEFKVLEPGEKKNFETVKSWNILPLVCYDLRFPVWSRNSYKDGKYCYDLLVYLSNWPESRSNVWKSLLVARAIENLSYVVGVNRIGKDDFGTDHAGESMIIDPKGTVLLTGKLNQPDVCRFTLSAEVLRNVRETYPFAPDWDEFRIETSDI